MGVGVDGHVSNAIYTPDSGQSDDGNDETLSDVGDGDKTVSADVDGDDGERAIVVRCTIEGRHKLDGRDQGIGQWNVD